MDFFKHPSDLNNCILLQVTLTYLNDTIFTPSLKMIEEINNKNLTLDDFIEDIEHFMMKIKYVTFDLNFRYEIGFLKLSRLIKIAYFAKKKIHSSGCY